jgi:hypothetical protein
MYETPRTSTGRSAARSPSWAAAVVELVEQAGLRVATNIVNCTPEAISIGLPVRVVYVDYDTKLTLAYFEPAPEESPR